MKMRALCGMALLLTATTALAAFGTQSSGRQMLREQSDIQEQVDSATGKYSRFKPEAMERIAKAQQTIFELLGKSSDIDHLNNDQKTELFNAAEVVRAVINENEQDRLVCVREKKTGTTLKETRCATVAQIAEIRDGAQTWKGERSVCASGTTTFVCGSAGR